jgi:hypothetical protein
MIPMVMLLCFVYPPLANFNGGRMDIFAYSSIIPYAMTNSWIIFGENSVQYVVLACSDRSGFFFTKHMKLVWRKGDYGDYRTCSQRFVM